MTETLIVGVAVKELNVLEFSCNRNFTLQDETVVVRYQEGYPVGERSAQFFHHDFLFELADKLVQLPSVNSDAVNYALNVLRLEQASGSDLGDLIHQVVVLIAEYFDFPAELVRISVPAAAGNILWFNFADYVACEQDPLEKYRQEKELMEYLSVMSQRSVEQKEHSFRRV